MNKVNRQRPFGAKDKWSYAMGDLGCNMSFALNSYLMLFYTQYIGLDLGTWGIIILLLKIWDAINDPIMGALMDALKPGKRGKFKTYIYYGSFVLLFSGALCFLPIPSAPYPIKVLVCVVGYLIWAMIVGIGIGVWQTFSRHRLLRGGLFTGTLLIGGVPNFVAALLLMLVFGVWLKWLPVSGLDSWKNYILPVCALALYPACSLARLTGTLLAQEKQRDYVLLARTKGLKKRQILFTHILPHIWIPVLNYLGPASAFLLTGSFVVESIFTIPGLGRQFVSSIANRDYTLILGLTIFMGAVVILIQLAVDLLSACIDPRVRRSYVDEE